MICTDCGCWVPGGAADERGVLLCDDCDQARKWRITTETPWMPGGVLPADEPEEWAEADAQIGAELEDETRQLLFTATLVTPWAQVWEGADVG